MTAQRYIPQLYIGAAKAAPSLGERVAYARAEREAERERAVEGIERSIHLHVARQKMVSNQNLLDGIDEA